MSQYKDIFEAAEKGTVEDVRYFIETKHVDVNAVSDSGNTPLNSAVRSYYLEPDPNRNIEVIKYLISEGADVNAGEPLLKAVFDKRNLDVVKILVDNGADVNIWLSSSTLLHQAANKPYSLDVLKYLISKGADVNAKCENGSTPLHWAVRAISCAEDEYNKIPDRPEAILDCFISHGADVNAKDGVIALSHGRSGGGDTPIHAAVSAALYDHRGAGHPRVKDALKYLISKGANVSEQNASGQTPLDIANLVLQHNFDPDVQRLAQEIICILKNARSGTSNHVFQEEKIMSVHEQIAAIEAVVNEYEKEIQEGRISVEILRNRMNNIADPEKTLAKVKAGDQEWIKTFQQECIRLSGIDKIDMNRLRYLKRKYPDDPRIETLVRRAVKTHLKLYEIYCVVAGNLDMMRHVEEMLRMMFPDTEK